MIQNFLNFCTIFFQQIYLKCVHLFAKNMKGWSHKKIIFYFFCTFDLLSNKLENNFFMRAPLLCANISQIFFSQLDHQKYLLLFIQESVQLVPSLFHILQQAHWNSNWILWKSLLLMRWVSTRTQMSLKSETDFKYFCLKCTNRKKMESEACFS